MAFSLTSASFDPSRPAFRVLRYVAAACVCAAGVLCVHEVTRVRAQGQAPAADEMPVLQYEPGWPKQLPNNWMMGAVGGLAVDHSDHIWIAQRPQSLANPS